MHFRPKFCPIFLISWLEYRKGMSTCSVGKNTGNCQKGPYKVRHLLPDYPTDYFMAIKLKIAKNRPEVGTHGAGWPRLGQRDKIVWPQVRVLWPIRCRLVLPWPLFQRVAGEWISRFPAHFWRIPPRCPPRPFHQQGSSRHGTHSFAALSVPSTTDWQQCPPSLNIWPFQTCSHQNLSLIKKARVSYSYDLNGALNPLPTFRFKLSMAS